jgi:hypothetical protein
MPLEHSRRHDPPKCTEAEFDPPKCTEAEFDPPNGSRSAGWLESIPKRTPTQIKTHRASVSALPSYYNGSRANIPHRTVTSQYTSSPSQFFLAGSAMRANLPHMTVPKFQFTSFGSVARPIHLLPDVPSQFTSSARRLSVVAGVLSEMLLSRIWSPCSVRMHVGVKRGTGTMVVASTAGSTVARSIYRSCST